MKVSLPILLFSILFLFVGCREGEAAEIGSVTAVSQVIVPTETAVPPTATTEPTPVVTETAVPLPSPTPKLISTLPPPTGQIYFLWDPVTVAEQYGVLGPFQNLYLASPGESADDWQIETLLEGLAGGPNLIPSPDKTTFAINPLEDTNGDGHISTESQNRGFDHPNIHLYSLPTDSLTRVTSDTPQSMITLLEDNKVIAYYFDRGLVVLNSDGSLDRQLSPPFSEQTHWIHPSPDNQQLAINFESGQLHLLTTNSGEARQATQDIGGNPVEAVWSPDSQWLAVAQRLLGQFFLLDAKTAEVQLIPDLDIVRHPTWSPDSQQIVMVEEVAEGFNLLLLNLVDRTTTLLLSAPDQIREVAWSPDGSHVAVSILQDDGAALGLVNLATFQLDDLWLVPKARRLSIQAWSPDNQWLLITTGEMPLFADRNEEFAGLYLIHRDTGENIQLMDTTGRFDPYAFVWFPNMENP